MASWTENPAWTEAQDINGGQQYTARDGVTHSAFNALVHNLLYLYQNLSSTGVELVSINVPAASATDKGKWIKGGAGGYYMENTFTDAPAGSAAFQSCTDVKAFTENGLRLEYKDDWEIRIDSLPATACTMFLLFIPHDVEDEPCIFPPLGVGSGSGTTGKYYAIHVPAAGSTDTYGWAAAQSGYELYIGDVAWMTEALYVELKSENSDLFTKHNISLYQDNGYLEFSIDSLPERESVLYVVVPGYSNAGFLNGG